MTQRDVTRRQLVRLLGPAAIGSIAGCAGIERLGQQDTETPKPSPTASPTPTTSPRTSEWNTPRATTSEPSTDAPTPETPTETAQTTVSPTTEPPTRPRQTHQPSPGTRAITGRRLFFEIDGDLVDFSQPKYYLKNLQQQRPETVYFHFHDNPENHGPNEWSNEKKTITFARALNLLPTIEHTRRGGSDVITYNGHTYRATMSGTSIDIYRDTESITPPKHTVQHNDNFWVRIETSRRSDATASGTRSGKLIIDINNQRLTVTSKGDRRIGTNRFEFRADSPPYTWYSKGQPVTLAEALNTLPDITYQRGRGDTSVITYTADNAHGGTYRETSNATTILTRQRWIDVNPQSYELQDGDIIWIYIHTSRAPDNEH